MSESGIVIVGGGLAGLQCAGSLRDFGYAGPVAIIHDEHHPPYHRPPLSKGYLLGQTDESRLPLRPTSFYSQQRVELIVGRRALKIERDPQRILLDDEGTLSYDHLIMATGARNRVLPVPGADLVGVHYLRALPEAMLLKERLPEVKHAVVIGAGFIGLEFASSAAKLGVAVTVVEVADRPMARAVSPQTAAVFTREHQRAGVQFVFNAQVARVLGQDGRACGVELKDGRTLAAGIVLVGIGVQANVELAAACGLEVGNGVIVNERLQTSDPRISAIGDCAAHPCTFTRAQIRLESVQNATDQARCVAARLCGKPHSYASLPWFWSDQGSLKLQIAGVAASFDELVMRGDPASSSCAMYCFSDGRLVRVETINRPADHMTARRLLANGVAVTPAQAGDESVDLKQLVSKAA